MLLYDSRLDCDSSEDNLQGNLRPPQRPLYRACTQYSRLQSLVTHKTRNAALAQIAAMLITTRHSKQ